MSTGKGIDSQEELLKIQEESQKQALPEQKRVFSVPDKLRRRVHNLPDPARAPLGYDEHKAFDRAFPYIRLPRLHPPNHGDTVIFNAPELPSNQLILGDNLEVLRTIPTGSIDLIYIDPPFFSGRTYNVIWGDTNEVRSFYDIWEGGIDSYLIWLNARLWEMRRVLKKTGSIYVHCDWHASHYIKTEMDKIFGYENFRNEIIWHYGQRTMHLSGKWNSKHDCILFYSKSDSHKLNPVTDLWIREEIAKTRARKIHVDSEGREYILDNRSVKKGYPVKKQYVEDIIKKGKAVDTVWDIGLLGSTSSERIGYPTQKPSKLLERIIIASSNEGDVVADLFCGGGTALVEAMKLKRRFIGCDCSRVAISVTYDRLVKIGEEMSGVMSNCQVLNILYTYPSLSLIDFSSIIIIIICIFLSFVFFLFLLICR